MHTVIRGTVAAIALAAIAVASWFLFSKNQTHSSIDQGTLFGVIATSSVSSNGTSTAATDEAPLSTTIPQTVAVSDHTKRYENRAFHFSLIYPNNLVAQESAERGNAITVTFQDPQTGEGFDIFVTPYSGTTITKQRFSSDEPSGVFQEPQDIIIGGTRATMFFGSNPIMGDTREVWFIHGGYLYEVATYKELDSWLGSIMQTWKFL
jgi:hypothetical protein